MVEKDLSEAVLGDLSNQLGKRGYFAREKGGGVESSNFNDIDVAKRICISPRRSNWISSLEGNVASSISNIDGENRDGDLSDFGCRVGFKSSVDVGTDCNNGGCLRGEKNVDIKVFDLGGEADVSVNVTELDYANDVVDSRGKIGYFNDGSSPDLDKTVSQDEEGPNLTDFLGATGISSISSQANCGSKPDVLKEEEIQANAEIVCENSGGGGEVSVGSLERCKGKGNISLMDLDRGNTFESVGIEAEFSVSLRAGTSRTVSKSGGNCLHDGRDFDVDESKASAEATLTDIIDFQNDDDYHNANDLILSNCGPFSCTSPPESQEYALSDKCALSEWTESIKACSCSFCTKAAYIWLDLNYQDIKARASAIKKIQKEASILSERSIRSNVIWEQHTESSSQISKFESELMCQWRPLFECMANVWKEEGYQLEARLQTLTGLRENCKADLELMYGPTSEKH